MHFADATKSDRLKRMLAALPRGVGRTTFELQSATQSCAVHSDIAELRQNGYIIERQCEGRRNGRQINRYTLRGRRFA
jgi:hypothetical protein